jgi:predicted glycoside hydrolase/deacetylase ChbG (UPF0249 family)
VKVTPREKTSILIAVGALLVVGIFYAATQLIPDSQSLSREVDLKKKMLRSQRDTLSREDIYKSRLEQYQKQLEQDTARFLPGENASMAGAELQRVVKALADQNGVEIPQRNIQLDKKIPDIATKVSIRIETKCTPEQLVQFLASIESYEKMLRVDELVISSLRIQKRFEIRPSLVISGYIRAAEETPKEKPAAKPGAANVS